MEQFKIMAHIHSLDGKLDEITVLEKSGDNDYIVEYKGVKCHALFNYFNGSYYADVTKQDHEDLLAWSYIYRRIDK